MPHEARRIKGRWAIVRSDTGKVVGYSTTKRKATISASIRDRKSGHGDAGSKDETIPRERDRLPVMRALMSPTK